MEQNTRRELSIIEQEARRQFTLGRFRESSKNYQSLCRHFPERLDIQARLGYLALLANDLDAAVAHLAKAINLGMRTRESLAHLAEAYYRKGQLGSAAYCYQRLGREGLAGTLAVMSELEPYRFADSSATTEISWVTGVPLPVLNVLVNGQSANLVLDTGAGDTVLDARFAVEAGVRLGGQELRAFAGGLPAPVTYGHVEAFSLGNIGIQHMPIQVIDIPPGFDDWFPDFPIHGILGTGVLSRFKATLDYRSKSLHLDRSMEAGDGQRDNDTCDTSGAPLWLAENQLLLTAAELPAFDRAVLFLDSGMTGGAFAIPMSRAETLGFEADDRDALVGTGGGGMIRGHRVRAEWLRLDRVHRSRLDGVVLDSFPIEQCCGFTVHGLIGHDLFRDTVLTLNFPMMRLSLKSGEA